MYVCVFAAVGLGVGAVAGGVGEVPFIAIPKGANASKGRDEEARRYCACLAESNTQAKWRPRAAVVIAMAICYREKEAKKFGRPKRRQEADTTSRWT